MKNILYGISYLWLIFKPLINYLIVGCIVSIAVFKEKINLFGSPITGIVILFGCSGLLAFKAKNKSVPIRAKTTDTFLLSGYFILAFKYNIETLCCFFLCFRLVLFLV